MQMKKKSIFCCGQLYLIPINNIIHYWKSINKRKKDYAVMNKLAMAARYYGDTDIASIIARDYIDNYLSDLKDDDFYKKENIMFISNFISSKEKYFNLFYYAQTELMKSWLKRDIPKSNRCLHLQ